MEKVSLITGASSGVGKAIAEACAFQGYHLVLAARRQELLEEQVMEYKQKYGIKAIAVKTDLTNYQEIEHLIKKTKDSFQRLDLLVNVAGEFKNISFVETASDQFIANYNQTISLMQNAVLYTSKLALELGRTLYQPQFDQAILSFHQQKTLRQF